MPFLDKGGLAARRLIQTQPDHAAWFLITGSGSRHDASPMRRPHRGQLPDIDWSRLEPDPSRRGFIARLFGALAFGALPSYGGRRQHPATISDDPETAPYMELVEPDESVVPAPADDTSAWRPSRAA